MSINITMPALSPTMEEGNLAKWHVKEGDTVSAGDVIAEIETDKATMEVEAVDEGTIGKILVAEGSEGVKVNAVIAVLLEEGEDAGDIGENPAAPPPSKPAANDETTGPEAPAPGDVGERVAKGTEEARSKVANANEPGPDRAAATQEGARTFASPLARRLAKDARIELSAISGSGPHGRVVKADIEKASKEGVPGKGAAAPQLAAGMGAEAVKALYEEGSYEIVPNDGMRSVVAARLTEARQTVPQFYITSDLRIDALIAAREEINAAAPRDKDGTPGYKISLNDFIMKAWALALQKVPKANATWAGDSILYHRHSDVAVAVAVPGGLYTPVVKACESKSLQQISKEVRDLATRAKSKKLAPHEYQGGTSAVSNLGMYGVQHFTSIINPPHGTIISIGVGEERVYADAGQVKTGMFMTVSLSCDHRSVDGALGAQLLAAFKRLIEHPVTMLA